MAVLTRPRRIERAPIRAARVRRRRFPWYFEMDSAVLFMAGVSLLALTCLLYLIQTSRVAVLGYEIQYVQMQQAAAVRDADALRNAIARKESLPAVETYARTKLGMKPVEKFTYVRVKVAPRELTPSGSTQGGGR